MEEMRAGCSVETPFSNLGWVNSFTLFPYTDCVWAIAVMSGVPRAVCQFWVALANTGSTSPTQAQNHRMTESTRLQKTLEIFGLQKE